MRVLAAGLALAFSLLPAAADKLPRPDPATISAFVRAELARDRVPGAAVAVIWQGEVILLEGFGLDGDGKPVTPQTGFRLGSMSKAFTALAVMRAVEAGRLSLDAPVQSVLSDFTLADPGAAAQITLRQLLAQTSGIPRTAPRAPVDAPLEAHVAALSDVEPAALPGERHIYSSPNYLVAARMLEVAEDRTFADILQSTVLAPLGLTDTLVTAADGHLAPGHRYWFGFPFPADQPEEPGRLATASLISSAADMARFLSFQLGDGSWEGQRLLSSSAMADMHRGTAEGDGFRYAMGWREGRIGPTRALHHGGILPDFRGKMILLPDLGAAVVVLTNASTLMPLPAQPTSHRLADEIAASLAGEPLASATLSFGTVVLAVWAGLAVLFASQVRSLWSRPNDTISGRRRLSGPILDLAVAAGLVAGPPLLIGLPWSDLWSGSPDLVIWTGAMVFVVAASGVLGLWRPCSPKPPGQKPVGR
jgi:CubicO group peptidase (beta-lactamase class C family)